METSATHVEHTRDQKFRIHLGIRDTRGCQAPSGDAQQLSQAEGMTVQPGLDGICVMWIRDKESLSREMRARVGDTHTAPSIIGRQTRAT
ncbi:hypothetical protein GCM10022198_21530 [Klugiella xanthotipulae]